MAGEKDVEIGAPSSIPERPTTSSSSNEKATISSFSSDDESRAAAKSKASYASIKPATATNKPTSSSTMPSMARSRSSRSARSTGTRSLSHARSHNGYGIDDLDGHLSGDPSSSSSDDPEVARTASKEAADPFEVRFDNGNADPWCPRSWHTPRKWLIVSLASAGSFCVTCASSIYTSSYTQMDAEFGCSHLIATLGLSSFVLGIALGPVWSPLSEFYGRRPIYLASFAAFTVFIIPCAVATNIQTVIVTRFFQGLSGSAFLSVSGGTVSDLFTPEKMHHPMTLFTAAPFLAPSLGPLIGGFINSNVNWRWTHYFLIIWAFCMFLAICLFVPETYRELSKSLSFPWWDGAGMPGLLNREQIDPVILRKKAQDKRKVTGDERWTAPIEKSNKSMVRTVGYSLMRPFQILAYEPMALILNIYSAILLGILYLFFGAFPLVFEGVFGFNLWQTGLTFLGMLLGMIIAALSSGFWVKVRARLIEKNGGKLEPEFRLPAVIAGSVFVTIGLFWFAWTTFSWVHWIMPIIGSGIFGLGVSLCPSPLLQKQTMSHGVHHVQRGLADRASVMSSFEAGARCQVESRFCAIIPMTLAFIFGSSRANPKTAPHNHQPRRALCNRWHRLSSQDTSML